MNMSKVKNKNVLKKVAREWAKSILLACDEATFSDEIIDGKLSDEEARYILTETHKIGSKLIEGKPIWSVSKILDKYLDYE